MNSQELNDKIAKLPLWAREHIRELEREPERLRKATILANTACNAAQDRSKRLHDALEALMELLRCAGRGGSDWAATVVETLESYEIFPKQSDGP